MSRDPNIIHMGCLMHAGRKFVEVNKSRNGLEPYAYLRYLFEKLPFAQTISDYLKLLPNRLDMASINKHAAVLS